MKNALDMLNVEEEREVEKLFKRSEVPLESAPKERPEEVIELVDVVEEPPKKRNKKELLRERGKLVKRYQMLKGREDPEAIKILDKLELQAQKIDDELNLLKEKRNEKKGKWKFFAIAAGAIVLILWAIWSVWVSSNLKQTQKALIAEKASALKFEEELKVAQAELKTQMPTTHAAPTVQSESGMVQAASVTSTTPTTPTVLQPQIKMVTAEEKMAIVQKGEGIERALIRQLQNDPFSYGFEGDATPKTVKKWAQKKAHQIAIANGYVKKNGAETRIKGKGGNIAYVLSADGDKISIQWYDVNTIFQKRSQDDLKSYEYVYRG